jgi:pentapeptide repeat protein
VRQLTGQARADAINAVRQTILAALGGSAALIGLGFTARTYYLSRRGQVTDRFSTAIGHLASERLEERLGGIYELEHVMAESPRDHATVLEVLCAFVRSRAPRCVAKRAPDEAATQPSSPIPSRPAEPPADIDAVMTVLARRPVRPEPNRPDLRHTALTGLSLREHDFATRPRLTRVFLTGADLCSADLRGLDLSKTILTGANLRKALLQQSDLTNASFLNADLRSAGLSGANLTAAEFIGANLKQAYGLTAAQLSHALFDSSTKLPDELEDDPWIAARLADYLAWLALDTSVAGRDAPSPTAEPH